MNVEKRNTIYSVVALVALLLVATQKINEKKSYSQVVPITQETGIPTNTPAPTNTPMFGKSYVDREDLMGYDSLDKMFEFATLTEVVITKVIDGNNVTQTVTTYNILNETCNDFSVMDGIATIYVASKRAGQSFAYTGPLIASESGFKFFIKGNDGTCKIIQNYQGAPAYCATQIYQPAGWGGANFTHPELNLFPPDGKPSYSLQNPTYCALAGMKDFVSKGGSGNGLLSAARYKGFQSQDAPAFVANYMPSYNAQGITVNGVWIPFNDDSKLEETLASEIQKAQSLMDEFYAQYPEFYFGP